MADFVNTIIVGVSAGFCNADFLEPHRRQIYDVFCQTSLPRALYYIPTAEAGRRTIKVVDDFVYQGRGGNLSLLKHWRPQQDGPRSENPINYIRSGRVIMRPWRRLRARTRDRIAFRVIRRACGGRSPQ